jgi:hypothetical protein
MDAGVFQAEISSFRLHLAAEGKSAKTIRSDNTEAVPEVAALHRRQHLSPLPASQRVFGLRQRCLSSGPAFRSA